MFFNLGSYLCLLARREKSKNLTGKKEGWGLRSLGNFVFLRGYSSHFSVDASWNGSWNSKPDTVKLKEAQLCIHHPKNRKNLSKLWYSLCVVVCRATPSMCRGSGVHPKEHRACVFCTVSCSFSEPFLSFLEFFLCCLPGFFLIPVYSGLLAYFPGVFVSQEDLYFPC